MKKSVLSMAVMLLLTAGCGTTTPVVLDQQMGDSVKMAVAQQTLNPQAAQDAKPVESIDGASASALMDRYHKSFEKPTTVNIFNLGVGGGGGNTLGTSTSGR